MELWIAIELYGRSHTVRHGHLFAETIPKARIQHPGERAKRALFLAIFNRRFGQEPISVQTIIRLVVADEFDDVAICAPETPPSIPLGTAALDVVP